AARRRTPPPYQAAFARTASRALPSPRPTPPLPRSEKGGSREATRRGTGSPIRPSLSYPLSRAGLPRPPRPPGLIRMQPARQRVPDGSASRLTPYIVIEGEAAGRSPAAEGGSRLLPPGKRPERASSGAVALGRHRTGGERRAGGEWLRSGRLCHRPD